MTTQSLDDVLAGKPAEAEEVGPEASQGVAATKTEQEPEPKGEEAAPPADEDQDDRGSWTKAAVLDERRKRQALEAELKALKAKEAGNGDEDGGDAPKVTLEERLYQERANITRALMMERHEDYEDMETIFMEMVKENPSLVSACQRSPNPAKFAYETAKTASEMKRLSDPKELEKLKEDMKEKLRKELLAELEQGNRPKAKAFGAPDIVKATGAAGIKDPHGDRSLHEILGR